MFRLATVPHFATRSVSRLASTPGSGPVPATTPRTTRPATADIRIRRLGDESVSEDSYSAILPSDYVSPIDLLRIITEACKDLPEFQVQGDEDERFILTLSLKS